MHLSVSIHNGNSCALQGLTNLGCSLALYQHLKLPCWLGFPRGKEEACLSLQVIKSGLKQDLTRIQPGGNCKGLAGGEALQPEPRQRSAVSLSPESKGVVRNHQKLVWEPVCSQRPASMLQHNTAHHMQLFVPPTGMEVALREH